MEQLQQLLDHPQFETALLVACGLLSFIGFIQVVRKGFAFVLWLMLFAVGIFPLMYVLEGSDVDFLANVSSRISGLTPEIADEFIQDWCNKLDQTDG